MKWSIASSTVTCFSTLLIAAYCQQNGDVRLVGGSSRSGRVELYLNGIWGTVEVRGGFLSGGRRRTWAAHTVCRQLGFPESAERGTVGDLGLPQASSSVPTVIEELYCGEFRGSGENRREEDRDALHVLRCDYDIVSRSSTPDHSDDFAVECNMPDDDDDDGYDTEVRLVQGGTTFTSSGYVEIYFRDSWGPVCNMGENEADTVCRQLGYTSSASLSSDTLYTGEESGGKVDEFTCTESRPCLRDCFDTPETDVRFNCSGYSFVTCTFDVSEEDEFSSGDDVTCTNKGLIIALAVGLSVGGVLLIIVIGFLIYVVVALCSCCKTTKTEVSLSNNQEPYHPQYHKYDEPDDEKSKEDEF